MGARWREREKAMTVFVIFHFLVCLFLVGVILLQPGKSDGGIAFGGGSSQSIFGSRGAGNFLTKTTSVCAFVFLFTSFVLTRDRIKEHTKSVVDSVPAEAADTQPPAEIAPAAKPTEGAKEDATPEKKEPLKTAPAKTK
jgi:preprotein translocase subunit SecG